MLSQQTSHALGSLVIALQAWAHSLRCTLTAGVALTLLWLNIFITQPIKLILAIFLGFISFWRNLFTYFFKASSRRGQDDLRLGLKPSRARSVEGRLTLAQPPFTAESGIPSPSSATSPRILAQKVYQTEIEPLDDDSGGGQQEDELPMEASLVSITEDDIVPLLDQEDTLASPEDAEPLLLSVPSSSSLTHTPSSEAIYTDSIPSAPPFSPLPDYTGFETSDVGGVQEGDLLQVPEVLPSSGPASPIGIETEHHEHVLSSEENAAGVDELLLGISPPYSPRFNDVGQKKQVGGPGTPDRVVNLPPAVIPASPDFNLKGHSYTRETASTAAQAGFTSQPHLPIIQGKETGQVKTTGNPFASANELNQQQQEKFIEKLNEGIREGDGGATGPLGALTKSHNDDGDYDYDLAGRVNESSNTSKNEFPSYESVYQDEKSRRFVGQGQSSAMQMVRPPYVSEKAASRLVKHWPPPPGGNIPNDSDINGEGEISGGGDGRQASTAGSLFTKELAAAADDLIAAAANVP